MNIKTVLLNYWKSLAIIACIFYLSLAPPSTFKKIPTFENLDKIVHILMYFGLSIVLIFEYRQAKKHIINSTAFILICLIFPVFMGGVIELMQEFLFPPRSGNSLDWISNIIGVALGWLAMHLIKPKTK